MNATVVMLSQLGSFSGPWAYHGDEAARGYPTRQISTLCLLCVSEGTSAALWYVICTRTRSQGRLLTWQSGSTTTYASKRRLASETNIKSLSVTQRWRLSIRLTKSSQSFGIRRRVGGTAVLSMPDLLALGGHQLPIACLIYSRCHEWRWGHYPDGG